MSLDASKTRTQDIRNLFRFYTSTALGRMITLQFLLTNWVEINNRCAFLVSSPIHWLVLIVITPPPIGGAEYCDERVCLSVCVCLSAVKSSEIHVRSSPTFLCMIPMAVVRSSSGGVVIRYIVPVLWMTSYLLVSQGCSTSPPS